MIDTIDFPKSAEIFQLFSPAFAMEYPAVWHKDLIPEPILETMETSWRTPQYLQRSVTFYRLNDVYIAEEGLIFDAQGQLYRNTVTQHSQGEIERGHLAVQTAIQNKIAALADPHVLCIKRGISNYGHWLMEMLPKAFLCRLYGIPGKIIIPDPKGQLKSVIRESMAMLQINEEQVLCMNFSPIHFDSVVVVDGLTAHGVYMSPLVINCADALSARVRGGSAKKLLVTRNGVASRRLINEDDVWQRAVTAGYSLLDTSRLSLSEQIAAFLNATHIVGVMGAALTNVVFAPRGASVLNFAPATMPDTFFWFIAGLKGQHYAEVRCRQVGPIKGVARWDTDLEVNSDDIDAIFPR